MTDIPLPGFGNLFISTCPGHVSALASWSRYSAPSHAVRCGLERPDFQVDWVMTASSFVDKTWSDNLNLQWRVPQKRKTSQCKTLWGWLRLKPSAPSWAVPKYRDEELAERFINNLYIYIYPHPVWLKPFCLKILPSVLL